MAISATAQRGGRPRPAAENIPETNPYSSPDDVAAGRKVYAGRCGHCHGQAGEGGRGAALTGRLRHSTSDREIFLIIRNGIPGTEMPATRLPDLDVWRMTAYVKQLSRQGLDAPAPSGDAVAGAIVYRKQSCAQCHVIRGQGGDLGPDLTDIGARRPARHLRESLVQPGADIPIEYRTVEVALPSGKTISGIHLNEDEYSVHMRDLAGNLQSFLKKEVRDVRLPRQSVMPAYASLSPADIDNLVAYLHSLRPGAAQMWNFDRLENIGGHPTTVAGSPKVVDTPIGTAVEFDGVDDALFVEHHPLAGAAAFTYEAVFRPDGGQTEQRWLHLSEQDSENRMLFEIRVAGGDWFLDSYVQSGAASATLMNRKHLHPLGAWYHVATVYDGKEIRNYVNGVREGVAKLEFSPHRAGRTSIGVRLNKVYYFKGAVHMARFTPRALAPEEFARPK
ncbi:MAG: c-type cytochrome [Bryobacteraceae bacterium]